MHDQKTNYTMIFGEEVAACAHSMMSIMSALFLYKTTFCNQLGFVCALIVERVKVYKLLEQLCSVSFLF